MTDEAPGVDLEGVSKQDPEVSSEETRAYENAALIGNDKLRSSGYFVNIVKRGSRLSPEGPPLILIVEDDAGTAAIIGAVLEKRGYATRFASNLHEINRALSAKPAPHLILLDILLPDANGFAVLERLRRHPELGQIPVVMLTSLSEAADVAKGLALGATGYMSKPARPQALIQAIRNALGIEPTS
jgi:two-component system, OmpR family, response regulator